MRIKLTAFVCLLLALGASSSLRAQSFYEVNWTGPDKITYYGLMVYYGPNNAFMRVRYVDPNKVYKVAEYNCVCSYYKTSDGKQTYLIDGQNAHLVYPYKSDSGYNADNFLFVGENAQGQYTQVYTIDDSQIIKTNYQDYLTAAVWHKVDPSTFTTAYLFNYFDPKETDYQRFLGLSHHTTPTYRSPQTKMYVVIVANSLDGSIGNGCKVDESKIDLEFSNIADALGITVEKHVIADKDFTKENVLNALSGIQPGSNDIVVFFYRGHGFRLADQKSSWPQMSMRYSPYQPIEGLPLEDVYSAIVGKGARLNLVFGDLCNSVVGRSQPTNQASSSLQSDFYPNLDKLRKLFLYSRGSILAAAASPGEVSWVNAYDGGFFTSSFFDSFHRDVSSTTGNGVSWENLVDDAISQATIKCNNCPSCTPQHGIRYIQVNYVGQ
jgi:hypothetical protein